MDNSKLTFIFAKQIKNHNRGPLVPYFIVLNMVTKEQILEIVKEELTDDLFLVKVSVSEDNRITVIIDRDTYVGIDDCIRISRLIEGSLDREIEDFSLDVCSAGLGEPFIVKRQYLKAIDKEIELTTITGQHYEGILKQADDNQIGIEIKYREKQEGKKKKVLITEVLNFTFDQIKTVKNIISFK